MWSHYSKSPFVFVTHSYAFCSDIDRACYEPVKHAFLSVSMLNLCAREQSIIGCTECQAPVFLVHKDDDAPQKCETQPPQFEGTKAEAHCLSRI